MGAAVWDADQIAQKEPYGGAEHTVKSTCEVLIAAMSTLRARSASRTAGSTYGTS